MINQPHGFSLLETIGSMAIVVIILLATSATYTNMSKENAFINDRMSALQTERLTILTLSNPKLCELLFAPTNLENPASMPFAGNLITATNHHFISLRTIPAGPTLPPVITEGERASELSPRLMIADNAAAQPGIQVEVTSMTPPTAKLIIRFNQQRLVRAVPNLEFLMKLKISDAINTTITGCSL